MSTALITGGTSGLGAAFSRQLAADGNDLILVARNEKRLEESARELAETYAVDVTTIAADLTDDAGCQRVGQAVGTVDLLVNNAGIGLGRGFGHASLADEEHLLDLNVRAVLRLTRMALPRMRQRGHGAVVNVSSVAGFAPIMPGSTYNASKAWVTNFSESLAPVARPDGVHVMALCPGFVHTEFHDRAAISLSGIPEWMLLDADFVVESALRDLRRGKVVSVPSVTYKAVVTALRHLPNGLLSAVAGRTKAVSRRGTTRLRLGIFLCVDILWPRPHRCDHILTLRGASFFRVP